MLTTEFYLRRPPGPFPADPARHLGAESRRGGAGPTQPEALWNGVPFLGPV